MVKPLTYRKNGQPIWPIMGGDGTDGDGAPGGGDPGTGSPSLTLTPEAIRSSPEFQALERENRKLARQKGDADKAAAEARANAETARQAAEAERQRMLEQTLTDVLGEDGVAAWTEVAELSQTDQVAAARRFAELMAAGRAQSAPAGGAPAGDGDADSDSEGDNVPAPGQPAAPATPPPPSRGLGGGAPLGAAATAEDIDALVTELSDRYQGVVDRNQDPLTRNRVTMRDRAAGMISYLGAAYLKALGRNGRPATRG